MPVNPTVRSLAQDGRFTLRDAQTLKSAVTAGTVSQTEAKDVLSRYAEAMDTDAQSLLSDAFQTSPRARLSTFPEGFTEQTLKKGDRSDAVMNLQRGLMSTGLSSQNGGMALASGADGVFGRETEASIKAFQKVNGIPQTGIADPATLKALQQAMSGAQPTASRPTTTTTTPTTVRPSTGLRRPEAATTPATTPATTATTAVATTAAATATTATAVSPTKVPLSAGVQPGTTAAVTDAATTLATGPRAANYGTANPWRNIDPNHAVPVDVRMGGLTDRWKCNLFGGNALAAAGFEPPYYGNKGKGEYPVAEDWHKWSKPTPEAAARGVAEGQPIPDYAARGNNKSRFDLQDEVKLSAMANDPVAKRARIQEFLDRVQPGDVVTADHVSSGSDGGHVRVCVGRDPVTNQPMFAQASSQSAQIETEGPDDFMNEEAIYILRPNTPRTPPAP